MTERTPPTISALQFQTLADLCAEVDAAGPRRWLIRGIWPAGAYGVHGAEPKAQKTWNALDLAVSVASDTPWLGAVPVDDPGPVIVFAGEGGKASIVRRIRAICASRNVAAESLPITVCARAPHLSNNHHLDLVAAQLDEEKPRLVILDPLYLSARGAKGSDLHAMGELLERVQHLCEQTGASLFVVTHYNRREGSGPQRFTGAGPYEWGRVLIASSVVTRHTVPDTLASSVLIEMEVQGGEVPDQTIRIRRDIRADDPADIDSRLHYHVEIVAAEQGTTNSDLAPAARKLLDALEARDEPATGTELVDWIANTHGHGLRRETVSRHLNMLEKAGAVRCTNPDAAVTTPKLWELVPVVTGSNDVRSHVTSQRSEADVTVVTSSVRGHTARSHHNGPHNTPDVTADDDPEVQRLLALYTKEIA